MQTYEEEGYHEVRIARPKPAPVEGESANETIVGEDKPVRLDVFLVGAELDDMGKKCKDEDSPTSDIVAGAKAIFAKYGLTDISGQVALAIMKDIGTKSETLSKKYGLAKELN